MIHKYDYLVIGSGIAGMSFALKVAEKGKSVAIICKTELEEANTYFAQGGIASVTNLQVDNFEKHIHDTMVAGDWINDRAAVEMVVRRAPSQIEELIRWGIKSNMVSYLTDCPHREKLPWLEQLHLMFGSLQYSYDMYSLYCKMTADMALAQTAGGLVPDIAPEYARFLDGFYDSPEWGSSMVLVPWLVYEYYGDDSLIRKYYDNMAGYVAYLGSKSRDHILSHGLGDWCDLGPKNPGRSQLTSLAATATPVYYMDAVTMAKAASLLGKDSDARRYAALADSIRVSYNGRYFNSEGCFYDRNSQTANAISLYFGLVEESEREAVYKNLVKDIRDRNYALTSGDIGYRYLLQALEDNGDSEIIYKMNTKYDTPGYGWQLAYGATALTESWQAYGFVSNNHCMLGHLMEWFFSGLGGIRQDDESNGYRKAVIYPQMVDGVNQASTSYESPYGNIVCRWSKSNDGIEVEAEIPANTKADIILPASNLNMISESGLQLEKANIRKAEIAEDGMHIKINVLSGHYRFHVKGSK